jgi:glycosyltransferase involved in cell wall biosynthesis
MVNSLEMGGSEHQMVEVARRQSLRGHRVTVACLSTGGPLLEVLRQAGITVVEFNPHRGLFSPQGLYQLLRLIRFLLRERPDVFQTHELYSTLLGVPAACLARVPTILSSRRNLGYWWWYTPRRRVVLRWIEQLSTFIIANSQAVCDSLVKEDGFDSRRIRVVRNAVDIQKFENVQPDRTNLFPQFGPEDRLIIAVANMNTETKGHTDLVRAAAEVCRDFPKARFLFVGDGCERSRIEDMAREVNLGANILFLGKRNDVPRILACCDLFVSSSRAEGLPNSVLEAMAAGLPVVATRVGGTPEIIQDGLSGLLVDPRDSAALARGMTRILCDAGFAQTLARAGRERVEREFSFDRLLGELDKVYLEGGQTARLKHRRSDSYTGNANVPSARDVRVGKHGR